MIGIGLSKDNPYHNAVKRPLSLLHFDGVDDYVDLGNHESISALDGINNPFTVEVWVYATDVGAVIYRGHYAGASGYWNYLIQYETSTSARVRLWSSGSGTDFRISIPNVLNNWHHLAFSYDGVTVKTYLDGVLHSSTPYNKKIDIGTNTYLGEYPSGGPRYLKGIIDDVRIWNVIRSDSEIMNNKDKKLNGNENGLVGCWKLDEGAGNIVRDSTFNRNHGSIKGGSWKYGVNNR